MASNTLFPPIVGSFQPAFIAEDNPDGELKVYFSLSSLSSNYNLGSLTVHASVYRKDGVKVIKNIDEGDRYRSTGIIINLKPKIETALGDNYYSIAIKNSDLKSIVANKEGWIPGWEYKIQLRLSTVSYDGESKQEEWLQLNSSNFSEWSTICYVKAISKMSLQIPLFKYNSMDNNYNEETIYNLSEVDFFGSLSSSIPEADEEFDHVNLYLYNEHDEEIDASGDIFKSETSNSYFSYIFPVKWEENLIYKLKFTYVTENGYESKPLFFNFKIDVDAIDEIDADVYTIDMIQEESYSYDTPTFNEDIQADTIISEQEESFSSIEKEEEEGRIALKIFSNSTSEYSGNICIRRSSMDSNFTYWEDIKIIVVKGERLNDLPIIYDYTIQSGVWYKYGIQSISENGERGILREMQEPVQRLFNYSYLLGQNDRQLKLNFDNKINSFKIQVQESKTETIGSKYPFVSRNAAVYYKTFPIEGLISFWMDENELFLDEHTFLKNGKIDIYKKKNIVNKYEEYNQNRRIKQYDYTYERDFRGEVLKFLMDGKPKLFKSPTEGNLIVRLTDINCSPNSAVDRLVYSFSCTASEIDDFNLQNCLKYGLYNPGTYSNNFKTFNTYLGQLTGSFKCDIDNIFSLIADKYESKDNNIGGYSYKLENIERVVITINDPPLRIRNNSNALVLGNNFDLNGSKITIYNSTRMYEFDSLMKFRKTDSLIFSGADDSLGSGTVNATIDFLYTLSKEPYKDKEISSQSSRKGVGQFYQEVAPGENIYNAIVYKYYFDSKIIFRKLKDITSIEIEANPHTVFEIKFEGDETARDYEVGDTGVLRFYNLENILQLKYKGKRYIENMYNDSLVSSEITTEDVTVKDAYGNDVTIRAAADVSIIYYYTLLEGYYKI